MSFSEIKDGLVNFDVSSSASVFPNGIVSGSQAVVTLSTTSVGWTIPLTGAEVMNGANHAPALCNSTGGAHCQTQLNTTHFVSAFYTPGTTLRVSFLLSELCSVATIGSGSWCATSSAPLPSNGTPLFQSVTVTFSAIDPLFSNNVGLTSGSESLTVNFIR